MLMLLLLLLLLYISFKFVFKTSKVNYSNTIGPTLCSFTKMAIPYYEAQNAWGLRIRDARTVNIV